MTVTLHIQPGARRSELAGIHGEALKIRLAAPPVDGKANAELMRFIAARADTARSCVTLLSGETSRAKRVRITGITAAAVVRWLEEGT